MLLCPPTLRSALAAALHPGTRGGPGCIRLAHGGSSSAAGGGAAQGTHADPQQPAPPAQQPAAARAQVCSSPAAAAAAAPSTGIQQRCEMPRRQQQQVPQLPEQQQQQQQLPAQAQPSASSSCSSSQEQGAASHLPGDGTVAMPVRGSSLWHAVFAGNVPTHWWQQQHHQHGPPHSAESSSNSGRASSSSSSSDRCSTSSDNNNNRNPSSWLDTINQSAQLQQQFRFVGATSLRGYWQQGQLMFGRRHSLRMSNSSRAQPHPRPAINRLAMQQLQHRLQVAAQPGANCSIRHQRHQQQTVLQDHSAAAAAASGTSAPGDALQQPSGQQEQQQERQQGLRLVTQRHHYQQQHERQDRRCQPGQDCWPLAPHRFRLRSHPCIGAAMAAARRRGWRPAQHTTAPYSASASSGVLYSVPWLEGLLPISTEDMRKEAEAMRAAAAAGRVTHCQAQRDGQGRLLPLPRSCVGAGCSSSSAGNSRPGSLCVAGRDCDGALAAGRRALLRNGKAGPGAGSMMRCMRRLQQQQQQDADGRAGFGALQLLEQQRQWQVRLAAQAAAGCDADALSNADDHRPRWRSYASVIGDDETDDDYDDDSDADEEDEDEEEEDDNEGEWVPPEVAVLRTAPHVFRNASGVVYGFWSRVPLG